MDRLPKRFEFCNALEVAALVPKKYMIYDCFQEEFFDVDAVGNTDKVSIIKAL
ncbi:hypothetical protein J7412_01025 [Shimia sp. R9_3]|nr:hypothetical protein [Shimia sp. R9_3]